MALKRGLLGVNRIRGGGGGGGGGSRSAFVLLVFFCVFAPLVFFVGRGVYIDSSNGIALLRALIFFILTTIHVEIELHYSLDV